MAILIAGLIIFLGAHSVRIVANDWRNAQWTRLGEARWKGLYSIVSLVGLVLIVVGFGAARAGSAQLWLPPPWLRHVALLLVAVAFVLVTAAYVPRNGIKAAVGHPMVLGVKTWAFAHLLANGRVVDVVLFGAFLAWAIADFASSRRRDRASGTTYPAGRTGATVATVVVGVLLWGIFGEFIHRAWFGVQPFGA
ncbi:MAG TPA: NnrU family protein [Burkholderiaceae bacterium]|nr:NnrU family protein [Burkholderiaceae bacterium]